MYEVLLTDHAKKNLAEMKRYGKKTLRQLQAILGELRTDPYGMTQPLHAPLQAYRSLHSGRFRAILKIVDHQVKIVYVMGVGWHESGSREDIYPSLRRALEMGLLKLPPRAG
jgi:mRNA-degrading endonuclease RelE of RelBE toxin-antitoxin system